jgi:hypothetical protein
MAVGNYTSFGGAVEKAISRSQLSPAERKVAEQLAQLSPKERALKRDFDLKRAASGSNKARASATTVGDDVLKLTGEAAKKAPKGALLKVVGKAAVPLAAAEQAYQIGRLINSEDARDEAAQDYENLADDNALMRVIKGGLGGVTTIYGAGRALADMDATNLRARKSMAELAKKEADPKNQQLVQSARERQEIYMSLPKEEQDKIDSMGGKEAKQYLLNIKNPRPAAPEPKAAPASSEPAPPSSPATAGAQKSSMERQMGTMNAAIAAAPKAIPVEEPVKVDMDRAMALFQNTHGGPFDPKSSMDKGKLAAIQNLMAQKGSESLTPNQFSLKIYRQSK